MKRKPIPVLLLLAVSLSTLFGDICNPPDVKLKNPPVLQDKDSFSMILFGDPQTYVKFTFNQPIFELMTAWTAAHKDALNIKAALCTGDIVDKNDIFSKSIGRSKTTYENTHSYGMWQSAARAFGRLDGVLPYILCTGNHDYGIRSAENRNTHFNEYFPISKNKCWFDCLVDVFPNAHGISTLENAAYKFSDKNWGDIIVVSLEFAPRDETIEWAKKLTKDTKYKNAKFIILTHSVLRTNTNVIEIIKTEKYKLKPRNWAESLMEKLVSDSDNIKLVLCGHSGVPKRFSGRLTYKNASGRNIPVVMFNPQSCSGWNGNGGDGWIRIMEFMPDGKTISMRTYSPLFAYSEATQDLSWNRDEDNEFKVEIE